MGFSTGLFKAFSIILSYLVSRFSLSYSMLDIYGERIAKQLADHHCELV